MYPCFTQDDLLDIPVYLETRASREPTHFVEQVWPIYTVVSTIQPDPQVSGVFVPEALENGSVSLARCENRVNSPYGFGDRNKTCQQVDAVERGCPYCLGSGGCSLKNNLFPRLFPVLFLCTRCRQVLFYGSVLFCYSR